MKKIKYLFLLMLFLCIPHNVFAEDIVDCSEAPYKCVRCDYHYGEYFSYDVSYIVYSLGDGTAEIKRTIENFGTLHGNKVTSKLKSGDFITENKDNLYCPVIKAKIVASENVEVTIAKDLEREKNEKDAIIEELSPNTSDENNKIFIDENRTETNFKCDIVPKGGTGANLPFIHVEYYNGNVTYSIPDKSNFELDTTLIKKQESELFSKGCSNVQLYMDCDEGVCILAAEQFSGFESLYGTDETSDEVKLKDLQNSDNREFEPDILCGKNNEKCQISLSKICEEPTVARTLQFIGFLIFLVKVLVPVIIIVMGFVNLFKIITAGKVEDANKYVKNIVTRVIIGVIIFLLPSIINFVFNAANSIVYDNQENKYENCQNCLLNPDKCIVQKK